MAIHPVFETPVLKSVRDYSTVALRWHELVNWNRQTTD